MPARRFEPRFTGRSIIFLKRFILEILIVGVREKKGGEVWKDPGYDGVWETPRGELRCILTLS